MLPPYIINLHAFLCFLKSLLCKLQLLREGSASKAYKPWCELWTSLSWAMELLHSIVSRVVARQYLELELKKPGEGMHLEGVCPMNVNICATC
jgi:hypothetical protein